MSLILHIDSATDICSVCLGLNGRLVLEKRAARARQHISQLSVLIQDLLKENQFNYADLQAVAVSSGPGSYTGLRVGYATAKGLCLALDIPFIEVDTLYSLAWGMRNQSERIPDLYIPMIDARRMEVYASYYDQSLQQVRPPHAWILNESNLSDLLQQYKRVAFGGNGAFKVGRIELEANHSTNLIISDISCDSSYMVEGAWQQYQNGQFANLAYCEPRYLKAPNITTPKKPNLN